jgi:ribosome-binding ATPase YchF (GTP1/OBG family)
MTQDTPSRLDRIEAALASHNDILTQLAPLTAQVTQLLARTAERVDNHSERLRESEQRLTRTERLTEQNAIAIANLEEQTTRNVEAMGRLELQVEQLREIVITSTTEAMRLVADQALQAEADRQAWQLEIREIWQYLRYQPRNGNGRSEQ